MQVAKSLVVALTGSIGCGKSEAAKIFSELGAIIIDADLLAREVVKPGTPTLNKVAAQFGNEYINADGTLNRSSLASLIFFDSKKREKLEGILHPEIRKVFLKELERLKASTTPKIIIYVAPLLFESSNAYPEIERIIVVSCRMETALKRIMKRDGLSREEALRRWNSQMPIGEKRKRADFVIKNDLNLEELRAQTIEVYKKLCADLGQL